VKEIVKVKPSLLSDQLKLFMVAMVLANIAGLMSGSLLPNYLVALDATPEQVGLFFTLSRVLPLALQILGGWVSVHAACGSSSNCRASVWMKVSRMAA
jgi:hypothetical protein